MANPIQIIESIENFEAAAGEFIRDGPSTGLPGYVRDGYRERCNQFANLPAWARLLGNGPSGALDRICTPYWNDNGWDGPELPPAQFTGGQCDGAIYIVNATTERENTDGTFQAAVSRAWKARGPIGGLTQGTGVGGNEGFGFSNRGAQFGASSYTCGFGSNPALLALAFRVYLSGVHKVSGVSVAACDLDNCGDLPTQPPVPGPNPPPDPGPIGGPVPTDDPNNPDGPPLIPLPPYQDPVYGPTPIVGPTGPTGQPGGGTPPPPPGDVGDPGGSSDTGAGGETEGEAPEGSVLVGLKIDVLASPPRARQFVEGIFRGAVYIYMGVAGNLDQDYGGSMLKTGQFFFAEKENLTHWKINANSGYNHRVTPYYRELE